MDNLVGDYLDQLKGAATATEVLATTESFVVSIGCSRLAYIHRTLSDNPWHFWTGPGWVPELFFNSIRSVIDFPFLHKMRPDVFGSDLSNLSPVFPSIGGIVEFSKNWADVELRQALLEADGRLNISFPVFAQNIVDRSTMCVMTCCSSNEFTQLLEDRGPLLRLITQAASVTIEALLHDELVPKATLSQRESECLLWLAKGLQGEGIAAAMSVSIDTVQFHLLNARRKLKAKTCEHALAKAIMGGLISP